MLSIWQSVLGPVALSSLAFAQTPEWATDFAPRGLRGSALDSVVHDDGSGAALYMCGYLLAAGNVLTDSLCKWDGAAWQPFSCHVEVGTGAAGYVASVESFDSGSGPELFVGGYFFSVDGVSARSIARWSNGAWSPVGSPPLSIDANQYVTAMKVLDLGSGPALYVGMRPPQTFPAPASLYKWDGAQWTVVGPTLTGAVSDLAVFDFGAGPQIVASGNSMDYGGPNVASVVTWDGTSWSSVGAPSIGITRSLEVFDDGGGPALFAGSGAVYSPGLVSKWNGVAWQPITPGVSNGEIYDLCLFDDGAGPRLFAGGTFSSIDGIATQGIACWDGVSWSTVDTDGVRLSAFATGSATTLAAFDFGAGAKLCVAGAFDVAGQTPALGVAAWNGSSFEAFGEGHGLAGNATTFAQFEGQLHVGGEIGAFSGILQSSLARWDGTRWRNTTPIQGNVADIGSFDDGNGELLFVSGNFTSPTQSHFAWDGSTASTPGGIGAAGINIQARLAHVGTGGAELYVAGQFTSIGGVAAKNIARWDGASWSAVGAQSPGATVRALAFHDDGQGGGEQLYAAGSFLSAGGETVFGIARYDGAGWSSVGNGFDGFVNALTVFDDGSGPKLYAAGAFSTAPPFAAARIARWDGLSWRPLGAGLDNGEVFALEVFDDGTGPALYAGGSFLSSGGASVRRLARWNGSTWDEVGGGADRDVLVLAALDDGSGFGESLWVGGRFLEVGGIVSAGIARWGKVCGSDNYCSSGLTSSGCVSVLDGIGRASASQATSFTLAATQLEGARSGHLFYGVNGAIASPWGQSTHLLCVRAPTQRTGTQPTNGTAGACDGAMSLDWNAYSTSHPGALGQPFGAGQDVWAQAYFRDPAGPKTTALTNGLHFVICP